MFLKTVSDRPEMFLETVLYPECFLRQY